MRWLSLAAIAAAGVFAACSGEGDSGRQAPSARSVKPERPVSPASPPTRPRVPAYRADPAEPYAVAKQFAGQVAQDALTYRRGATADEVAGSLPRAAVARRDLVRVLRPLVVAGMRSGGTTIYPQLSGVTTTSLGTMVVVRQTLEDRDGRRRATTRVLDIRLRRVRKRWELDTIASAGGRPAARPASLPPEARRVLNHPNIELPDSARWDIYRGKVDRGLLSALLAAAKRQELSIAVISSGHPPNVWASSRPSAHARGFAADIYAVGGRPVVRQRKVGSPAYAVAQGFFAGGARQIGSPWSFGGGARSFTDPVHQDHIHVQQSGG